MIKKQELLYSVGILLCVVASLSFSRNALGFSATVSTSDNVEVDVMPSSENSGVGTSIVTEEISIASDCRAGYDLIIQGLTDGNLYLNGDSNNDAENSYFTMSDGESALKNSPNTWGFSLTVNTKNGVFSPIANNGAVLKTIAETAVEDEDIDDAFSIYYGVAVSNSIAPGTYKLADGAAVTYQLTMSPMCIEYDIVYDGNGADGGDMISNGEELKNDDVLEGQEMTFYAPNYSKTGYGFAGWSLDSSAAQKITDNNPSNDPVIYGPNETITLGSEQTMAVDNDGNITVYATWIPSEGNLQGWNGCDSLSATTYDAETGKLKMTNELTVGSGNYAKSITALTDTRDNEVYAVAKLTDGKCWTIENLRLSLENVQITKANTNHPTDDFTKKASGLRPAPFANWGSSYGGEAYNVDNMNRDLPSSHDLDIEPSSWYSYGAYYKSGVLSAGNTDTTQSAGDICPSGWRLPVGLPVSGGVKRNEYAILAQSMGGANERQGSMLFRSAPNNIVFSGLYTWRSIEATWPYSYDLQGRGSDGLYATSNFVYSGQSNMLIGFNLTKTSITTDFFMWKYTTETVRCVSRDEEVVEVSYDANGGENAPSSSQSAPGRGIYEIVVKNDTPTRSGYTFIGWMDLYGNVYHGGDTYSTDSNSVLYAKWESDTCNASATSISEARCLQDMNLAVKASMTQGNTYTLVDTRDGKSYTVALLPDGNVWMTQNLNLGNEVQKLITSDDSDMESGEVLLLPDSALSFGSGSGLRIYNDSTYGGYYNFRAAVAGKSTFKGEDKNLTSSICPAGWDLPSKFQYDNLKTVADLRNYSYASVSPYNFIYAGYSTSTSITYQTSAIRLWTSTMYSSIYPYYSSAFMTASYNSNYLEYGESIRCVMGNGGAEIVYNGNGDVNYPVTVPTVIRKEEAINSYQVEDVGFDRPSWTFDKWNTQPDGSGSDITVGTAISGLGLEDGDEYNLYAQWLPDLVIVYHSNDENNTTKTEYAATGATYRTGGINYFEAGNRRIASWNTSADGSGNYYMVDSDYTAPVGMTVPTTLDLYAQWEPTYTIKYNGNGSDGDDVALMSSVSHDGLVEGDTVNLYASNFSRVGYGFAGWSFDPDAAEDLANATIYGPNETITAPAYTTSEVSLYAVWIAPDQTDTFQTFAESERCDAMTVGDVLALTDERDGNVYTVAKLADGKCWMTENMRLVLGSAGTDGDGKTIVGAVSAVDGTVSALNASNTNNPSFEFLHNSDLYDTWQQYTSSVGRNMINFGTTNMDRSATASYIDTARSDWGIHQESSWYSYGVMYGWYTATAGRGLSSNTNYSDAVLGDICPVGWHLAKGTSTGEFSTLKSSVGSLVVYPNNFILSGEYYTSGDSPSQGSSSTNPAVYSAARERGITGYYWLSNPINNSSYASAAMFAIGRSSSSLTYTDSLRGNAVRCIASEEKEFTLEYNVNDGESMSTTESHNAVLGDFEVTSNIPMRSGFTFEGWSDLDGNVYHAGDTYRIPYSLDNGKLYAIWSNDVCNPEADDISDAVCLQDMNGNIKATMIYDETYTLVDARDNKEYTVALLNDNNVWITKNINYGTTLETMLTNNDTDLEDSKPVVLPGGIASFSSNKTLQYMNDDVYGGFYNFGAATLNALAVTSATSICPKGWDLPTRIQYNDYQSMTGVNTYAKAAGAPYNFVGAGYISGSNRTTGTNSLWTSQKISSDYAFTSNAYEQIPAGSYVSTKNSIYYGRSVRCVMNNGSGTVYYDANGGSGTIDPQVNVVVNSATIATSSGLTAPDVHKQFKEWNTEADGSGITVKPGMAVSVTGISDGGSVTLYAQWDDVHVITFVNTVTGATQTKNIVVGASGALSTPSGWGRTGYTMAGWDTNQSGETVVYTNSQTVTPENDFTVYTVWKQNYTVNYNVNTNDPNAEGTMSNTHTYMYEGRKATLSGGNFSRTNYGFVGWSFDPNAANDIDNAVIYGPHETISMPAYVADTVTLYAVWVPSAGSIQNFDCSTLQNVGDITALTDSRDGDTYAVAKLADGECWMIENMRLSNSADASLMATDSQGLGGNFTTLPASSSSWGTSSANDSTRIQVNTSNTNRSSGSNMYVLGNYYSWAAAIADDTAHAAEAVVDTTSICPAGWHLPNGGPLADSDFYHLTAAITGITLEPGYSYSGNNKTIVHDAMCSFPNNFVNAGYWSGTSAYSRNSDMRYWTNRGGSSVASGTSIITNAYTFYYSYNGSYLYPGIYQWESKYTGLSVRCIAD